jgi:hypothetical protein
MWWMGVIALTLLGLWLALQLAIVATALIERRPVKFLTPADPDDPEWRKLGASAARAGSSAAPTPALNPYAAPGSASSYAERQVRAATELRFSPPRLFKHIKGGTYKTYSALMVSPTEQILSVVRWGTLAKMRTDATLLYSALDDGTYLITSDRITGVRSPGIFHDLVYLDADFSRLVERHEERMLASGRNVKILSGSDPLAELEAIYADRARFLIEQGDAYWADPEQTAFRSTFKGAVKTATAASTKHVDQSLKTGRGPQAAVHPALVWTERICMFVLVGTLFLGYQRGPGNLAQKIFRLGVAAVALLVWGVVLILKAVLKRRSGTPERGAVR